MLLWHGSLFVGEPPLSVIVPYRSPPPLPLLQELNVRNHTTDAECTIVRMWVRVPMSNNDLHRLGRLLAE